MPAINFHGHEAVINLAPGLCGASRLDEFAEHDVRQHLADLAGREESGCVQFILLSSHRLQPVASEKLMKVLDAVNGRWGRGDEVG